METTYRIILGILISLIGLLLTIYAFINKPKKEESESSKSANIQLKIFGIGLFIGGLIYAF